MDCGGNQVCLKCVLIDTLAWANKICPLLTNLVYALEPCRVADVDLAESEVAIARNLEKQVFRIFKGTHRYSHLDPIL